MELKLTKLPEIQNLKSPLMPSEPFHTSVPIKNVNTTKFNPLPYFENVF